MDFQLDLLQKQAVEEALTKGVVVVTGWSKEQERQQPLIL